MTKKLQKVKKIVIVGAGGFGKEVLSTILACNRIQKQFDVLGFIDDDENLKGSSINDLPILGNVDWLLSSDLFPLGCVIAIGEPKIRKKIQARLETRDLRFPKIIHPSVIISEFTSIEDGTIIQAGSIISPNIKIGKYVFVNVNSTIGHDCILEDFVTVGPGCMISGENIVEEGVFFGNGVMTRDKIKIGKWSFIGAGSVVGKSIHEKSMQYAASGILKSF